MAAIYPGDETHPPQPFSKEPLLGSDAEMERLRTRQDELDAAIRQQRADLRERADLLAEVLASDPARFRLVLGIQTEEDYAIEAARAEAQETWELARIKRARLGRERKDG